MVQAEGNKVRKSLRSLVISEPDEEEDYFTSEGENIVTKWRSAGAEEEKNEFIRLSMIFYICWVYSFS